MMSAFISGSIGIFCAYRGYGVWAIVIQSLISAFCNAFLGFVYVKWCPSLIFSKESFRSLFRFGSKLLISQIIGTVYVNLYNLAIGKQYAAAQLGFYTRASQFGQMFSTNLSSIMTRVSFPILSKIQDDDERLIDIYRKFIKMSAFILFPLTLGLGGVAKPLILTLLTEKWAGCIILLQILSFAYLCDGITIINLNLLYVKGRSDLVLRLEIIKKSIAFIILFATIWFGLEVICIGQVLYALIALVLNTTYTKKILHYGILDQIKDIFPYFLFSLIMMVVAIVLGEFIHTHYLSLLTILVFCPLLYWGLCAISKQSAFYEMKAIIFSSIIKR